MKSLPTFLMLLMAAWITPALAAGPRQLTDAQMSMIAAGQTDDSYGGAAASSGAIVGDDSTMTIHSQRVVQLSDTVQQDVRAMNLVNAAESSVANGVNIWTPQLTLDATGSVAASTPNTLISPSNMTHVDQTNSVAQDQSRSTTSLGKWTHFKSHVDTAKSSTMSMNDTASVTKGDPTTIDVLGGTFRYSSGNGRGAAGGGIANLTVDTGKVSINPSISIGGGAGGSFGFGFVEVGGEAGTTVELPITLDLPKLTLDINGAACIADEGASCGATRNASISNNESSNIASVPTSEINDAQSEFIVVGDSQLDVKSSAIVMLSGSAQQGARAMNVVNSANSVVGTGVNIAVRSGTAAGGILNLKQTNLIIQRR